MSQTPFTLENLDRLRFLLDLPELSYFPSTFIYAVMDKKNTRLDFVAYPENLSARETILSQGQTYSVSPSIKKSIGLFLTKEAARVYYKPMAAWSRQTKQHLVLMEYKNDKLLSLLCVSQIKPEQRLVITQALEALRERYWLEETAPKPKLVLPEIDAQAFNTQKEEPQDYTSPEELENIERIDPHQKKVKAYQHKI